MTSVKKIACQIVLKAKSIKRAPQIKTPRVRDGRSISQINSPASRKSVPNPSPPVLEAP